jgi:hypothetical protein
LQEREVKLNSEYITLLEKHKSGTQERLTMKDLEDKVNRLQSQVEELDTENKLLQVKIDSANLNVGSFVSDMQALLDQHEITAGQMLGNNIMDVEDSAGGAHDYDEDEDAFMDNDDDEDHYRARH